MNSLTTIVGQIDLYNYKWTLFITITLSIIPQVRMTTEGWVECFFVYFSHGSWHCVRKSGSD